MIDSELIARIRRSDEHAFYAFCNRHWKSLYLSLLNETSNKDEAFERVKGLFVEFWDKRKHLPELSTTVVEYIVANGLEKSERNRINLNLVNFMLDTISQIQKLPVSLGLLLRDKHLKYK
ncbi:hypothetical protein GCM10011386_14400 [Parapedobacter defluvii]|uniref:Uncharacterized protein n=1 Tax=Parapedobacter defluvii TaxID=2045106 RepID=A0ABQ1LJH8_9SPHI|nr:hypothetical protein [Parapedobacter defluvii]GGC23586.1 hypothetical protein GCM10011386_14400 [Parapedobacter defluvii]